MIEFNTVPDSEKGYALKYRGVLRPDTATFGEDRVAANSLVTVFGWTQESVGKISLEEARAAFDGYQFCESESCEIVRCRVEVAEQSECDCYVAVLDGVPYLRSAHNSEGEAVVNMLAVLGLVLRDDTPDDLIPVIWKVVVGQIEAQGGTLTVEPGRLVEMEEED